MSKYRFCLIAFVFLIGSSQAIAGNFKNSLGVGIQYGGIIGWQGAFNSNQNKFRLSLGYAGMTFGYDRFLGSNVSLGAQGFVNQYRVGSALSLNYYFGAGERERWYAGLDIYRGYDSGEAGLELIVNFFDFVLNTGDLGIDAQIETGLAVSVGYEF